MINPNNPSLHAQRSEDTLPLPPLSIKLPHVDVEVASVAGSSLPQTPSTLPRKLHSVCVLQPKETQGDETILLDPTASSGEVIRYLNDWVADHSTSERKLVVYAIATFLTTDKHELKLIGSDLPDIFHVNAMTDKLQKLTIEKYDRPALPESICALKNLKSLSIVNSNIEQLPSLIGELNNLIVMDLTDCHKLFELPATFSQLIHLERLSLAGTLLSELPECITKLTDLHELNLNNCRRLNAIPDFIKELENLYELSLRFCTQLTNLPHSISVLKNLRILNLEGCRNVCHVPTPSSQCSVNIYGTSVYPLPADATLADLNQYLENWVKSNPQNKHRENIKDYIFKLIKKINKGNGNELVIDLNNDEIPNIFNIDLFKSLRFYHIIGCNTPHLPNSISNLSFLWRLIIENSAITKLPPIEFYELNLIKCNQITEITDESHAIGKLKCLKISSCHNLSKLDCKITNLSGLLNQLTIEDSPHIILPDNFYREALKQYQTNKLFKLFGPVGNTVEWMHKAITRTLKQQPYEVRSDAGRPLTIYIDIPTETTIPFAQEHLDLVIDAIEKSQQVPTDSSVRYFSFEQGRDPGIDASGLSKDYYYKLLPNIALQLRNESNPIFTYSDERNCFELRKNTDDFSRNQNDVKLCRNIGKLLAIFALEMGKHYKIGAVFPKYFYEGILYLEENGLENLEERSMKMLAFFLATEDEHNPLFNIRIQDGVEYGVCRTVRPDELERLLKTQPSQFTKTSLVNIWQMFNEQLNETEQTALKESYPQLEEFVGSLDEAEINKDDFYTNFVRYLHTSKDLAQKVELATFEYAYNTYGNQVSPLTAVAVGFREIAKNKIATLKTEWKQYFRKGYGSKEESPGAKLANAIQGESVSLEGFKGLMWQTLPIPNVEVRQAVDEKKKFLQEWYLQEDRTQQERKDLLRIMTGTDIVPRELTFGGPAGTWNLFRTCFNSVWLGSELLRMPLNTEKEKENFIELWKKNLKWASEGGFHGEAH